MKKYMGSIGVFLVALLVLLALAPTPVLAATTAGVAVNATPAYVTISNAPTSYGFGTVEVSTNYSTTTTYFTITNGSSVNIDIAISCNATWAGGNTWTHDDTGTPAGETAALYATPGDASWNIIVKNATPNDLYSNTADATPDWGLRLMAPTSFDDGVLKTNTVTLTATAT
jgi:hypothetical protein